MDIGWLVFVILVFTTFINQGVQMYIHFEAYPLLANVGKTEFPAYLKEYERRLAIPLLLPYVLTVLSNLALLALLALLESLDLHPDAIGFSRLLLMLVLNVAVAVVTIFVATPVYVRIRQAGYASASELAELMKINRVRLGLSSLSSLVMLIMLFDVLDK